MEQSVIKDKINVSNNYYNGDKTMSAYSLCRGHRVQAWKASVNTATAKVLCFTALAAGAGFFPVSASAADLATRYAALYQAAQKEGQVIYYNEARQEENSAMAALWQKNFPKVRLQITAKQTMSLISTIETERAAGHSRADVVTITEPHITARWKAKGYYRPYKVQQFGKFSSDVVDVEGTQYVTGIYLLMPAYNTKAFPDKSVLPKTFADFKDPKWKSKMVLADPKTAASNLTYFFGLMQLGQLTWPSLEQLAPQDILFVRGNAEAADMLAAGERVLSPMVSTQNVVNARNKGQPIDFLPIKEASIELRRTSGIFANSEHPNGANLLLEVITDPEVQGILSKTGAYWPTNADAPLPPGLPKLSSLNAVKVILETTDEKSSAFVKRFSAAFGRQ
jgi:iron(III) transport system substrate-binding protein